MFAQIDKIITAIDNAVWGLPLICLIMATGIFLTARLGLVQIRHLGKAFKFMFKDEEDGSGEVTSFGALCTALSATIGTGNITGVATAIALGGPGALFWMVIAAFFGMATKYAEGLLAIKYRTIDEDGHVLGGPFYYIENGMGKIRIAKQLNEEGIPCPSEYKRLTGEKYRNNHRLESTTYWTYATIHRILQNEMYIGNMEQGRDDRLQMHGKAKRKERSQWTVVSGTHQPIIEKGQWQRVQALLNANARTPDFQQNVSPFAGFLKCGDCGRAMVKTTWGGKIFYTCGSYKRYGASVCSKHYIAHDAVAKVVLDDLNRRLAAVEHLRQLAQQGAAQRPRSGTDQPQKLEAALQRIQRRRQSAYEDYQDALISKEDFLRYRADYDAQEQALQAQLDKLRDSVQDEPLSLPWVKELLASGQLAELDRPTVAAAIREIRVYEGNRMEIDYLFPEGCRALLEG